MARRITQRELRNESGSIMRALDRDEEFVITRNGVPVGELRPVKRRRFVRAEVLLEAFAGAEPISADQLRADVDALIDPDPWPGE